MSAGLSALTAALAVIAGATPPVSPVSARPPEAATALPVALIESDPGRRRIGSLDYLGGLDLRAAHPDFGGISALRWRDGRLYAVTDQGDWMSFAPVEDGERLIGVEALTLRRLRGFDGSALTGKPAGDAEALAWDGRGWLVSFEQSHAIGHYSDLGAAPVRSRVDPVALFGPLDGNAGVEAVAVHDGRLFLCAERVTANRANCAFRERRGAVSRLTLPPPAGIDQRTGVVTDADFGPDGTLYLLFRSWSAAEGNRVAIAARPRDGRLRTLALLGPPFIVDNFEGLAVREQAGRTYLYIVSDDNFSRRERPDRPESWQRTLLLKFEVVR